MSAMTLTPSLFVSVRTTSPVHCECQLPPMNLPMLKYCFKNQPLRHQWDCPYAKQCSFTPAEQVDDWNFNAFELDTASDGRPLSTLAFALLSRGSLISHFKINSVKLAR
eukprot:1153266-Pelagomonas_calceolata.AAC.3